MGICRRRHNTAHLDPPSSPHAKQPIHPLQQFHFPPVWSTTRRAIHAAHAAPEDIFNEAYRRHPNRELTTPSSLLKYAIPCEADQPFLPNYQRLHLPRLESPRLRPPPAALAPAKVEEVPEDVRQNWHCTSSRNTNPTRSLKTLRSTQASLRLFPCY